MKTLYLPLQQKWYDMIEKGIKTEDYREIKPHWISRFIDMDFYYWKFPTRESVSDLYHQSEDKATGKNFFRDDYCKSFDTVTFSLCFTSKTMTFKIEDFTIGTGKSEWGAVPGKEYFIIKLGRRLQ